jgi:hypothetical protein
VIILPLSDDAKEFLNNYFEKTIGLPIKFEYVWFYRPVFHELPFENIEPIEDIKRASGCEALYVLFKMRYQNRDYEYEVRFSNNNRELILKNCFLKYFSIFAHEQPEDVAKDINKKMEGTAKLVCMVIVTSLEKLNS